MIDGDTVRVLRIRRAQRRPLTRKQIDDASEQDKPETDRIIAGIRKSQTITGRNENARNDANRRHPP